MDIPNNGFNYEDLPHDEILCIDMKAFYASVEAVTRGLDPLKAKLVVIGDKSRKGSVVLAASPVVKEKYNIKTGNRLFEIPQSGEIKIVEARMALYLKRSLQITKLLNQFVPLKDLQVYSVDEAWLKLNGVINIFGDKWEIAIAIKERLLKEYGLPCSMGMGPNMFLAKVAMDTEGKSKGLVEWTYDDIPEKLWPVKLSRCWGIGKRMEKRLNSMGIKTVGELAQLSREYLEKKFGIMGVQLYNHAWGVDLSQVEGNYKSEPKNL
ncbi:MAG: DNA polymerase thumb domain-containing protein, partial [Halanaerobiales bacterium]